MLAYCSLFLKHICIISPLVFVLGAFPAQCLSEPLTNKLRVGVIVPLSGEAANLGESVRNAIVLALEKLSPDERSKFDIRYEDDRLDPKNTLSSFHRLKATSGLDAVITISSGTSKPLSTVAEQSKIPHIAVGASDPAIVANKKWVVNFWVTPEAEALALLDEAKRRGYKKIAAMTTIQEGFLSLKKYIHQFNKGQLAVVLDEEYPQDTKDFRPFLTKLRTLNGVDGLLMLTMPGHTGVFAKQAREMGIKMPLFGIEGFEDPKEVEVSAGALIDQWYINADHPDESFVTEYLNRFPDSSTWIAGNAYDLVFILAKSIERDVSKESVNDYLHSMKDFSGCLGTYSASGDNRFTLTPAVKVVTKSGFKKIRTVNVSLEPIIKP